MTSQLSLSSYLYWFKIICLMYFASECVNTNCVKFGNSAPAVPGRETTLAGKAIFSRL